MVWERIDFALFHENVLCDLVSCRCLAGSSCGAVRKWHFCTFRASWRAHGCLMLDNRSSTSRGPTAHCQVAPAVQRIAFLHRPSKAVLLCSWHGWHKGWGGILIVGLNYYGELLGLADVMTGEADQFCERFSHTDGLRVFSMKADHRRLLQEAKLVSPFLLEYHCMSLPECQL